ncbi:triphosphate tunel metalloenzyme 3-like [Sesamum indicum]|uniref:Triphosphate tunel metalloenzyme 3-like n=1 Tax=Sesamum indicum TaxID=4182 RepID=A0A6I9SZX9_SESIN|nr:triphosphate tunel metalloenzyme 3-like [Sesamum indicum]
MEVEVKFRLPNKSSHQKLLSLLSQLHITTLYQLNVFVDGSAYELSSQRAVLLLRLYEQPRTPQCVICLKAKPVLADGVSHIEMEYEEPDPAIFKACLDDPQKLMLVESRVLRKVKEEFGVKRFVGLGGFRNVRNVYKWKGVKLEVDEAKYEFGEMYEVECETSEPERVKKMIEQFFTENGIEYSYSVMSKFAVFQAGKLPS